MNCPKCGNQISEGITSCEYCGASLVPAEKTENVVTGIVGALVGAAIGAASIILLSRLGYIASISGFILAVCTLKGYELLGGKLSGKGIVICLILMLITPYLADRIDWAILLMQEFSEYGLTLADAFRVFPELLNEGAIEMSDYFVNLAMIYGFAILGAFKTLRNAIKK